MKKILSLIAVASLFFMIPVLVWSVKSGYFDRSLVLDNRLEGAPQSNGAEYFFEYAKADPLVTSAQHLDYGIDEMKEFDTIFISTEDGFKTTIDQWNKVKMNIDQNQPNLLFAEYGVIHNAESGELSQLISQDLGVESTNWAGMFVSDLSDTANPAIPEKVFENVNGPWTYSGPGLILNNSNEERAAVIELLSDGEEISKDDFFSLRSTDYGKQRGFDDLEATYEGLWFDITEPMKGTEVLYNFDVELHDEAKATFSELNLPMTLPAVTVVRDGPSQRLYLAGTFSQAEAIPEIYQVQGIHRLYAAIERFSSSSFYWNSFFPIMQRSLELHQAFTESIGESPDSDTELTAISYPARVGRDNDRIEIKVGDRFEPLLIKGVNIGMAKPGYFPGEAAITEEEYYQWFVDIGKMNANAVRVYTLHPPGFYRALARYNAEHDQNIYVLHGVWINEEWITGDADAFHEEAVDGFQREIRDVVDALHGNALVPHVPGHASGVYVTDVSDYIIGWILGTEWDPFMVQGTDEKHSGIGQYNGTYYSTTDASPFEHWLALQMDYTTTYEAENYKVVRPMSFTNWVTTDILHHPSDNSNQEDISEVDPNSIHAEGIMTEVGQFASYHIYPYYPDFLQMDQKYVTANDWRGEPNTYFAYLEELRSVHEMPVLVAEFGIPTSRGRTHTGPMGMHQGAVTEQHQGEFIQRMFEDILEADYMGGLVFTWQDEWFKRTWNTMDFDNPDRRPFWSNAQTSEQQFGLLSFDNLKVKVDGDTGEWENEPIYEAESADAPLRAAYVDHDERYLFLRFDFNAPVSGGAYPVALIDTIQEQGNHQINAYGITSSTAADFLMSLEPGNEAVHVDAYYDVHAYLYGYLYGFIPFPDELPLKNSGHFVPIKYVLNQQMFNPETGETTPFEEYETGRLLEGNGNPDADDYNSLTDFSWSEDRTSVEVRIPWLLLSFKDPSRKEITSDFITSGSIYDGEHIDDIGLSFMFIEGNAPTQTMPETDTTTFTMAPMRRYTWENWDRIEGTPRLKQSYFHLQDYFAVID
ncbi:hypothetical protein [Corynebacterium cystitidis]|uniref:Glycosyl hydrolases family 2, TIM barrel domain n=1 Tax=Corynebacterium cystitidis DSM 20524 TaxID=1121357 RepID=A0A1H9TS27_9CORY|nr:hypothetical protein [Corynebacterium cystitidis]WJY81982.1 hypothetical protein CCYS_05195 [Corynebacterium cystitidis DSM 20524]SER99771.1 hypothetical protein SAMN05661109_01524 [Corynebacterium cystitidis DSM 20524]SNV81255.1 Uncharacterised protein [Corynebacterium cystitidis]